MSETFDYVIVGAGSAGCAMAYRLSEDGKHTVLVLEGPIGVGKTSLAQQLAHDLADHFEDGIIWARADFADPRLVKLDIARALGFDTQLPEFGPGSTGRQANQGTEWGRAAEFSPRPQKKRPGREVPPGLLYFPLAP